MKKIGLMLVATVAWAMDEEGDNPKLLGGNTYEDIVTASEMIGEQSTFREEIEKEFCKKLVATLKFEKKGDDDPCNNDTRIIQRLLMMLKEEFLKNKKNGGLKVFHQLENEASEKVKEDKKEFHLAKYARVIVDEKTRKITIVFTGMGGDVHEIKVGGNLKSMPMFGSNIKVHGGFYKKFLYMKEGLLDALSQYGKDYTYHIYGHSMGGVFATFAAMHIAYAFYKDDSINDIQNHIKVITFGSPPGFTSSVFSDAKEFYNCLLGPSTVRVYYDRDWAPGSWSGAGRMGKAQKLVQLTMGHVGIPFKIDTRNSGSPDALHVSYISNYERNYQEEYNWPKAFNNAVKMNVVFPNTKCNKLKQKYFK